MAGAEKASGGVIAPTPSAPRAFSRGPTTRGARRRRPPQRGPPRSTVGTTTTIMDAGVHPFTGAPEGKATAEPRPLRATTLRGTPTVMEGPNGRRAPSIGQAISPPHRGPAIGASPEGLGLGTTPITGAHSRRGLAFVLVSTRGPRRDPASSRRARTSRGPSCPHSARSATRNWRSSRRTLSAYARSASRRASYNASRSSTSFSALRLACFSAHRYSGWRSAFGR